MASVNASVLALGVVVALAAALRGTWSPCGQSMLSQITPIGEASRGNRYRTTARWYLAGSVLGGLTLGAVMALLAGVVHALELSTTAALAMAAGAALLGAIVDSGVLGFAPPFFLRQVNEDWLGKYRAWFYGSGFGWQVGCGRDHLHHDGSGVRDHRLRCAECQPDRRARARWGVRSGPWVDRVPHRSSAQHGGAVRDSPQVRRAGANRCDVR